MVTYFNLWIIEMEKRSNSRNSIEIKAKGLSLTFDMQNKEMRRLKYK